MKKINLGNLSAIGVLSLGLLVGCSAPNTQSTGSPTPSPMQVSPSPSFTPSPSITPSPSPSPSPQSTPRGTQTLDLVIKKRGELSQFNSLVNTAKLDTVLQGPGPFTVFAPNNQAISKLNQSTLSSWSQPQNLSNLVNTLTMHVVPGVYFAKDLQDGQKLNTLQGAQLTITKNGNTTYVNGLALTTTDINASNGVVHVVTGVFGQ